MSASIVSRVSVNTTSAAIINDSAVTSAFVANSSNSSIGVAVSRFAAQRSSSTLARFRAFFASASARRIASKSERFTRSRRGFLCHRYQLRSCGHDKLRVDEKCVRERVQVRCSDFAPTNCCICQCSGTPSRQVAEKESVTCTTPKHLTPQHPLLGLQRAEQRVNTIPPDTEIHEQMTMTNGYVRVCTTTSTLPTSMRPLWTTT